jgi:hypothetical protein
MIIIANTDITAKLSYMFQCIIVKARGMIALGGRWGGTMDPDQ